MAELQQKSEIAFFDVETTLSTRQGRRALLEFGAIFVCPEKFVELENYSTLICPTDHSFINPKWERRNGITSAAVSAAPPFSLIADKVFDLLNGRIWAGHNIKNFDCPLIREAFAEIGRSPPEPKGIIDSLVLLTEKFGRRAGDMKMATLATYFGLGQQTHRSLDDVRMNLEVLKCCGIVLLLESSFPDLLASDSLEMSYTPNTDPRPEDHSNQNLGEQILQFVEPNRPETESFNMTRLSEETMDDAILEDDAEPSGEISHLSTMSEGCSSSSGFLTPDDVNIANITAFRGSCRNIRILHDACLLKLHCTYLKVRFGISKKFVDQAGRPKLSFVVDAPSSVCQILDACDNNYAHSLFMESGSTSDCRPVVERNNVSWNYPTVRLHIHTIVTGDVAKYATEIFQKETSSAAEQKLVFSKFDAADLEQFFTAGTFVDAFFSVDTYDYQQKAGIRLVAKKLVIHCK